MKSPYSSSHGHTLAACKMYAYIWLESAGNIYIFQQHAERSLPYSQQHPYNCRSAGTSPLDTES
eukprot:scaffold17539_cov16-Tisochrysis_lutea.AAC.1